MLRIADVTLAVAGLLLGLPLFLLLTFVGFFDTGKPLFRQRRIGTGGAEFTLFKFRTMRVGTRDLPTHLAQPSDITGFGRFLRRTKLDELPQLWNVLLGQMSFVGPRPCLPSQLDVIEARRAQGVLASRPGITGFAQLRGIDMSEADRLARADREMMERLNLRTYLLCIFFTAIGRGRGDRVRVAGDEQA
jgi:lipopolysaccharide/colanic/teichoic acid biosynthesis glycosyltransferase